MRFVEPPTEGFTFRDHIGSTVVITPDDVQEGKETRYGPRDVVYATILVRDDDADGRCAKYEDVPIFGAALVPKLRKRIGEPVLGIVNETERGAHVLDHPDDDARKWAETLPDPTSAPF